MIRERATLSRKERLRRRREFQRLYQTGTKTEVSGVLLFWRAGGSGRRVGIAASRRVGGSVERNRARRVLREAYRLNKELLPSGLDILLVARPGVVDEPFQTLCGSVARGFRSVTSRLTPSVNAGGPAT